MDITPRTHEQSGHFLLDRIGFINLRANLQPGAVMLVSGMQRRGRLIEGVTIAMKPLTLAVKQAIVHMAHRP